MHSVYSHSGSPLMLTHLPIFIGCAEWLQKVGKRDSHVISMNLVWQRYIVYSEPPKDYLGSGMPSLYQRGHLPKPYH